MGEIILSGVSSSALGLITTGVGNIVLLVCGIIYLSNSTMPDANPESFLNACNIIYPLQISFFAVGMLGCCGSAHGGIAQINAKALLLLIYSSIMFSYSSSADLDVKSFAIAAVVLSGLFLISSYNEVQVCKNWEPIN